MPKQKKFSIDWDDTLKQINEQTDKKSKYIDERIYYPKLKDDGTGSAKIRFLPAPDQKVPWSLIFSHSIYGPNGWYIQNCPTTPGIDKQCPACEDNRKVWSENDEDTARKLTKGRNRKANYYTNILIVKDPANPENEGKVFLFRYGVKIHEKIIAKIKPSEEILKPVMIFDYYDGADFNLIIKRKKIGNGKSVANYDDSNFDNPSSIDEEKLEQIVESRFSISEFIQEDKFLTYDVLKQKYDKVMGTTINTTSSTTPTQTESTSMQTQSSEVVVNEDNTIDDEEAFFQDIEISN